MINAAGIVLGVLYGILYLALADFENSWAQKAIVALFTVVLAAAYQLVLLLIAMVSPVKMKAGVSALCNLFGQAACAISPLIGKEQLPGAGPFWLYSGLFGV